MYENLWLIPLGFVAGVLGSIVGLGGGIIAVPVMTFAGFPPSLAASITVGGRGSGGQGDESGSGSGGQGDEGGRRTS